MMNVNINRLQADGISVCFNNGAVPETLLPHRINSSPRIYLINRVEHLNVNRCTSYILIHAIRVRMLGTVCQMHGPAYFTL